MAHPLQVAVGLLFDPQGQVLLAQRPVGRAMAGYWEFPGGKIETGETPQQALIRECREELGIELQTLRPWLVRRHTYSHAQVVLHFFKVSGWRGEPQPQEGQRLGWFPVGQEAPHPLLPANVPLFKWLALPPHYAITQAQEVGEDTTMAQLEQAFRSGLRLVQVREKGWPTARLVPFVHRLVALAQPWGVKVMVNGETDAQAVLGISGIHLTARQLNQLSQRPAYSWVSASCHTLDELQQAARCGLDFVVLGPVASTKTHPKQLPLGWHRLADWVRQSPLPLYAIGGMTRNDALRAQELGAQGVALLRGWAVNPGLF